MARTKQTATKGEKAPKKIASKKPKKAAAKKSTGALSIDVDAAIFSHPGAGKGTKLRIQKDTIKIQKTSSKNKEGTKTIHRYGMTGLSKELNDKKEHYKLWKILTKDAAESLADELGVSIMSKEKEAKTKRKTCKEIGEAAEERCETKRSKAKKQRQEKAKKAKKAKAAVTSSESESESKSESVSESESEKPKKKRGRPAKEETAVKKAKSPVTKKTKKAKSPVTKKTKKTKKAKSPVTKKTKKTKKAKSPAIEKSASPGGLESLENLQDISFAVEEKASEE